MTCTDEKQFRNSRINKIAALIPGAVVTRDGDGNANGFALGGEESIFIGYNSWGAKGNRFAIHGRWPSGKIGDHRSTVTPRDVGAESPNITVSADRSDEQIARDIQRRFIPAYRELLVKCIARRDANDRYLNARRANTDEIARLCGGNVYGQDQYNVSLPGDFSGEFEVCSDSASLRVRNLSLERAHRLAWLLRKWAAEDAQRAEQEVAS